ncbi:thiamine biosynthesis lipoprotein [Aquimarina spongiae]|uniref:FAD:protein FMN transferase n=2 Tax=Aquimarina spongiae TaxID=570521 RepID=A0A1M6D453_9FLAO|nr:thiamine biosynthesis lipoprotein [Aquimarina spongiae]
MKFLITLVIYLASYLTMAQQIYKRAVLLMGSDFEITVVAENKEHADRYIDVAIQEIQRIEQKISSWDQNSLTSSVNKHAGILPVEVDKELFDLITRSIAISRLTDGAFDISYASMDKIWKFDGTVNALPSSAEIKASIANVGFQNIKLNKEKRTVFLPKKGMKIGFGAIGKGYAADKAKELLIVNGVKAGIINASGDMSAWGVQPDKTHWKVAITNPLNKKNAFAILPLVDRAVVTSGNYEKYLILEGKRYAHIIDPRTGYPTENIAGVTVFAPKAELADALATSVFVMGVTTGMDRINQLDNIECIIIDNEGNIHTSKNIKIDQ